MESLALSVPSLRWPHALGPGAARGSHFFGGVSRGAVELAVVKGQG